MKKAYLIPSLRVADIAGEEVLLAGIDSAGVKVNSNAALTDEFGETKAEHLFSDSDTSTGSLWDDEW